jgi:adenylyltransferase/sulfurtransferase
MQNKHKDFFTRYSRHIELRDFGEISQNKLIEAHVAIIGIGGLGSPASLYLSAAGIGHLTLVDDDEISISNLQRQILFSSDEKDKKKVDIASSRLLKINPNIQVDTYSIRLNTENIDKILSTASIILDCTDNFETRYLLNEYAILNSKILISGSVGFYDGQIMIIKEGFPCYQCLYPEIPNAAQVPSCVESAVLGPVVGVIGSLMATEAIKEISKLGQSLAGKILTYSSLTTTWQKLDLQIDTDSRCNLCKECKQYANPMA